jgi:hypothetical protein
MKSIIKLFLPISMMFVLTGCCDDDLATVYQNKRTLELNVQKTLTIQSHNLSSARSVTYAPGKYWLQVDFSAIAGQVVLSSEGHENVEFPFPSKYWYEPNFKLKGSEIGEPFDIKASKDVDTIRGKATQTVEYCVVGEYYGYQSVIEHVEAYKYYSTVVFVDSESQADLAVVRTFINEDSRKIIDKYLEDCPAHYQIIYETAPTEGNPHRAWPV